MFNLKSKSSAWLVLILAFLAFGFLMVSPALAAKITKFEEIEKTADGAVYQVLIHKNGRAVKDVYAHLDIRVQNPSLVDPANDWVNFTFFDTNAAAVTYYLTRRDTAPDVNVVHDSIYLMPTALGAQYLKIEIYDGGKGTYPGLEPKTSFIEINPDYGGEVREDTKNEDSHWGLADSWTSYWIDDIANRGYSYAGAWGGTSIAKQESFRGYYFESVKDGSADIKMNAACAGVANMINFASGGGKYAYSVTAGASAYSGAVSNPVQWPLAAGWLTGHSDGFDNIGSGLKQLVTGNLAQQGAEKGAAWAATWVAAKGWKYAKFAGKAASKVPVIGTIIDVVLLAKDFTKFIQDLGVDFVSLDFFEDIEIPTVGLTKGKDYVAWVALQTKVEAAGDVMGTGHAYVDFLNNEKLRKYDHAKEFIKTDDWGIFLYDAIIHYYPDIYPEAKIDKTEIWDGAQEKYVPFYKKTIEAEEKLSFKAKELEREVKSSWQILDKDNNVIYNQDGGRLVITPDKEGFYQIILEVRDGQAASYDSTFIEVRRLPQQTKILSLKPTAKTVAIAWQKNKDTVFNVYNIYISKYEPLAWELAETIPAQAVTSAEIGKYQSDDLLEYVEYCFKVGVQDIWGREVLSKMVCEKTLSVSPPKAVQLYSPQDVSQGSVVLSWSQPEILDELFSHYEVHAGLISQFEPKSDPPDSTQKVIYSSVKEPNWFRNIPYLDLRKVKVGSLKPETKHYFKIALVDIYGKRSYSNEISVKTLEPPPEPVAIISVEPNQAVTVQDLVAFDGSQSYDSRGNAITSFQWQIVREKNPTLFTEPQDFNKNQSKIENLRFRVPGYYTVYLTVTNEAGGQKTASSTITVNSRTPKLEVLEKDAFSIKVIGKCYDSTSEPGLQDYTSDFLFGDISWDGQLANEVMNTGSKEHTITNLFPDKLYHIQIVCAVRDFFETGSQTPSYGALNEIKIKTDIPRRDLTFLPLTYPNNLVIREIGENLYQLTVGLIDKGENKREYNKPFKVKFEYSIWREEEGQVLETAGGVFSEEKVQLSENQPMTYSINWLMPPRVDPDYDNIQIIVSLDPDDEFLERREDNNKIFFTEYVIDEERVFFKQITKKESPVEKAAGDVQSFFASGTPDSPFYFVDKLSEKVQSFFTFNKVKKAELKLKFAQERAMEAKAMVDKSKLDYVPDLIGEYKKEMAQVEELAGDLPSFQWQMVEGVSQSLVVFNTIKEAVPEQIQPMINELINMSGNDRTASLKNLIRVAELEIPEEKPAEPKESEVLEEPVGPEPEPEPEPEPIPESKPEGPDCGNGTCEAGENCSNCSADCACGTGKICQNGNCVEVECTSNADCNDNKVCTQDTCVNNSCQHQCLTGQSCNDGNNLTINDTCIEQAGQCICRGETIECYNDANCNDDNSCTIDTCHNAGTSNASCSHTTITSCINNDGCCPSNCNSINDNNCQAACGNGVCESGENYSNCSSDCPSQCSDSQDNDGDGLIDYPDDLGCESASDNDETNIIDCRPESEDADCEDDNPCTDWICEAEYGEGWQIISSHCELYHTINECYPSGDGCCPAGCTYADDPDCLP